VQQRASRAVFFASVTSMLWRRDPHQKLIAFARQTACRRRPAAVWHYDSKEQRKTNDHRRSRATSLDHKTTAFCASNRTACGQPDAQSDSAGYRLKPTLRREIPLMQPSREFALAVYSYGLPAEKACHRSAVPIQNRHKVDRDKYAKLCKRFATK